MNKIIPLVLVVSLSLIFGTQTVYAQTDVWAFYGEIGGSDLDATTTGNAPDSDSAGIASDGTKFFVGHTENYQNVNEAVASAGLSGSEIQSICFGNAENPVSGTFSWDFTSLTTMDCVQNQRGDNDLGLGVDESPVPPGAAEDEVEVGEILVLDLSALLGNYENFMFRISSNTAGEQSWIGTSDSPPTTPLDETDFTFLGLFSGASVGNNFNDVYTSFTPKQFLYYSGTDGDNLLQQIKADKMEIVGGHGGITDNTALLVSGSHLTASWMIPLIVAAIGIAVFVVTRKQS